ncbi:MAG: SPOR domain-containing protein, partial [Stellaceae bacterium]
PVAAASPPIRSAPIQAAPVRPALSPAAAAAARELGIAPAEISPRSSALRTASARSGGVRLQLGAVRSESEARGTWDRLKHNNADLLGKLSSAPIRADLGDKGVYYRIQTAPVADPSIADRICGELRQRHLACVIIR